MPVSVASPITYAVIGSEHKRCFPIAVEIVYEFCNFLDTLVNNFDIVKILFRVRPIGMPGGIQPKQMEEEDALVPAKRAV